MIDNIWKSNTPLYNLKVYMFGGGSGPPAFVRVCTVAMYCTDDVQSCTSTASATSARLVTGRSGLARIVFQGEVQSASIARLIMSARQQGAWRIRWGWVAGWGDLGVGVGGLWKPSQEVSLRRDRHRASLPRRRPRAEERRHLPAGARPPEKPSGTGQSACGAHGPTLAPPTHFHFFWLAGCPARAPPARWQRACSASTGAAWSQDSSPSQ